MKIALICMVAACLVAASLAGKPSFGEWVFTARQHSLLCRVLY